MELLRDFTNRPGMTFDPDKTFILYAEDLEQIKENFALLNQMLSLSRQYGTSFTGAIKQGDMPVGETATPPVMEMAGGDVLDDTSTERGGDVAIRPGENTTTFEKGNSHIGSADGSVGYSVAGEMTQHRYLPLDFNNIDDVMTDDGSDYLQMKRLKDFLSIANTMRSASAVQIPFVSGSYYDNVFSSTALTTLAGVANRFEAFPFFCPQDVEISKFGVVCSTLIAASNIKLGVYDTGADGLPANLILGGTDISTASTGYKSESTTLVLEGGKMYWFAIRHSSTAIMRAVPPASTRSLGSSSATATTFRTGLRTTLTYSTDWPSSDPFTSSDFVSGIAPILFRFLVA